jgi:hypothetical protein
MEEKKGKITPFQIRRNFGPGSIAILDACETGTGEIGPDTPIGRLAEQKVAATIATMAPVEGAVAAAYMNCMSSVLSKSNKLTVGNLHFSVTNCMSSDTRYHYEAEIFKYFLVGNPFQPICSPRGGVQ